MDDSAEEIMAATSAISSLTFERIEEYGVLGGTDRIFGVRQHGDAWSTSFLGS